MRPARRTKRLKAMSNEHRLLILCQLLGGERRVAELEQLTGLGQSALSQHLAKLRASNLVRTRRKSQNILYSLASDDLDQVVGVSSSAFLQGRPSSSSGRNQAPLPGAKGGSTSMKTHRRSRRRPRRHADGLRAPGTLEAGRTAHRRREGRHFHFTPSNPWVAVQWRKRADIEVPIAPVMAKKGIDFISAGAKRLASRTQRDRAQRRPHGSATTIWSSPPAPILPSTRFPA